MDIKELFNYNKVCNTFILVINIHYCIAYIAVYLESDNVASFYRIICSVQDYLSQLY